MNRLLFISVFATALLSACNYSNYEKTNSGIIVKVRNGDAKYIKADVLSNDIIHVQAGKTKVFDSKESLVVVENHSLDKSWSVGDSSTFAVLSTSNLKLTISYLTGETKFYDAEGNEKLIEKVGGGKIIKNNKKEVRLYQVQQVFESPDDEALYGLGQHQNMQMNYKGQDVDLSQHNLVAVVPFLVSNKNYGILWHNYSRSKFGDIRDYESIGNLKLYNDNGEQGGLTAKYYKKDNASKPIVEQVEREIQYENLDEIKNVPESFNMEDGMVRWSGQIESAESGIHKFLLYSAGYLKLWIDNELIIDSWRQCWNPWTRKINLEMDAGKKKSIKIEWIPDGGESYVSLKWLSPNDQEEQNRISLYSEAGRNIDYYYINGKTADDVIKGYRELTGKAPIMPKWAMGYWQSRERYKSRDQLMDVVKEYRKRKIPLDNIVIDWHYWEEDKWGEHEFDLERFPNPKEMIEQLHNDWNTHVMISVWAKYYEGTENYKIMEENGFLYKRNIEKLRKDWVGPGYVSTFYDTFNEDARKEFWRQINEVLFSKGIDAWWMDATEPDIHSNVSWDEKKRLMDPTALGSAEEYFNAYSLMQSKGVYDGQRATKPNQRVFILTRSAFAGQQRYAAATWSGDIVSRWFDFKAQIPAGLNFSLSGIPYWTMDIGGFAVEKRYEKQDLNHLDEWRELNTRWFQYGAFCPLFRSHGQLPFREIYNIAPENTDFYKSMVYYSKLRYKLMPYIYSLAGATYFNDYTIMRPLVMDFSDDEKALNITDEYMFGPALLVAPVTDYKARSREVYLPTNTGWYDYYTNKFYTGGAKYTMDAPISRMPLLVKEGSILIEGAEIQYALEKAEEPLSVHIYQGADGQFFLYEDEGVNYNYEKGDFCKVIFDYDDDKETLTIGDCIGTYKDMPEKQVFNIYWHNKESDDQKDMSTVTYYGNMIQVKKDNNIN